MAKTVRLYHGTRAEHADSIRRDGLKPGACGLVWAAENYEQALLFARNLGYGTTEKVVPAVVTLDVPAGSFFWERALVGKSVKGNRVARFAIGVPATYVTSIEVF